MKELNKPEIEIVHFDAEDVITTSDFILDPPDVDTETEII